MRLVKAPEKYSSSEYIHLLEEAGVQFFQELGYKLVLDNAPIHRSHAVNESNEWKTPNGIQSVAWPAHSRVMSPIENFCKMFALMKTQLRSTKLEFAVLEGAVCAIGNKIYIAKTFVQIA